MKNASKFNRGGCFKCGDCGRKTRDTGDNGSAELCPECYERGSWENEVSDNGESPEALAEIERLRAAAIAKGGVFGEPAVAAPAVTLADRVADKVSYATKSYEEAKSKFIERATLNPADAIEWSESMLLAQHKYVFWTHADERFKKNGREGLVGISDHFLDSLLMHVGGGRSTSLLANANQDAEQRAQREVYGSIKNLLEKFPA